MGVFGAVIFDLDGVLVDTAEFHLKAWERLANHLHINLPNTINESLKGVGRMDALDIVLSFGKRAYSPSEKGELAELKNGWYLEQVAGLTRNDILSGVLELLKELNQAGIPLGLASASKNAKSILIKVGLTDSFDVIVDGTTTSRPKPDPEVFVSCANQLNVEATHCLVIEDAIAGIQAAKSCGMQVIGVGDQQELSEADLVVKSTAELTMTYIENCFLT